MASITIRDLDDTVKRKLRVRAAQHGRSTHEPENLAAAIRRHYAPLGGMELDIPQREPMRKPPRLRR